MSKEQTPEQMLSQAKESAAVELGYISFKYALNNTGAHGMESIMNEAAKLYASLQNAELLDALRKIASDKYTAKSLQYYSRSQLCNIIYDMQKIANAAIEKEKLGEQLNSVLPEIKLLKSQNAELINILKELVNQGGLGNADGFAEVAASTIC